MKCLQEEGYGVEWRVINAAEYGCVQRRRRTFIFAFKNTTKQYKRLLKDSISKSDLNWLVEKGFFASAFPLEKEIADKTKITYTDLNEFKDTVEVTKRFKTTFYNSGVMLDGHVFSA